MRLGRKIPLRQGLQQRPFQSLGEERYSVEPLEDIAMVKIGEGSLLEHYSLLVPKDSKVLIGVDVAGWNISLEIEFDSDATERSVKVEALGPNKARIIFNKWDNSIGTVLNEPTLLANLSDGRELVFLASNYMIGTVNKLDLQLMLQKGGAE